MLLKNLKIENIRSYNSLNLNFNTGKTLLSGDIGAGKTTILLAIEFALFGLIRGILSGSTLLRHGKQNGRVELEFEIDNQNIKISRSLKKTSNGIVQDAGYIEINGTRTESTAVELKSKILEIIGYPEELLTKSKNLLFRYTVYTPQEEMKQILYESKEERLEKIRKLFDIDKYKRIKENAAIYTKELRSEIKANSGIDKEITELTQKNKELELQKNDRIKQQEELIRKIKHSIKKEQEQEEKIEVIKEEEKKLQELKKKKELLKAEVNNNELNKKNKEEEILDIKEEKIEEKPEKKTRSLEEVQKDIDLWTNKLEEMNNKKLDTIRKSAIFKEKKKDSEELINKIGTLKECPTCKQEVTEAHKKEVEQEEKNKIKEYQEKEETAKTILEKIENNIATIKEKQEALRKEQSEIKEERLKRKIIEEKLKREEEKKKRKETLNKQIKELKEKLELQKEQLHLLDKQIKESLVDEDLVKELNDALKKCRQETRILEIKQAEIKETLNNINENIKRQEEEKNKKQEKLKKINQKKTLENWLSNQFINLTDTIEKHVLSSIYTEFNTHFQEWFNNLIEDETINANIDETFTPIIIQNGYETEIDNLSGGEKTSVALAYRLALNQVINDFMNTIKTKGLLILDEPTDGFSTHQLDKLRDVLEEIKSKQILIVSHEPKMESFVENIIRITKNEHKSEAQD